MQVQLRPAGVEQLWGRGRRPRRLTLVREVPAALEAAPDEPALIGDLERYADLGCLPPRHPST
jgi:hypothetical protein